MFYAGKCPSRIELPNLVGIRCQIQLDCLNGKYRVMGGRFEDMKDITICEPAVESIGWNDIPPQSPIEKLANIICSK